MSNPTTIPYTIHLPDGRKLRRFAQVEDDGTLTMRIPPEYQNCPVSFSEERTNWFLGAQEEPKIE